MKVNEKNNGDVQILEVEGDLDFHSSPDLRDKIQTLIDNQTKKVLINLGKVNYMDSSGIATFVEAFQKMRTYEGNLVLAELTDTVQSVFEIAKLDSIFQLAKTEDEGCALLSK